MRANLNLNGSPLAAPPLPTMRPLQWQQQQQQQPHERGDLSSTLPASLLPASLDPDSPSFSSLHQQADARGGGSNGMAMGLRQPGVRQGPGPLFMGAAGRGGGGSLALGQAGQGQAQVGWQVQGPAGLRDVMEMMPSLTQQQQQQQYNGAPPGRGLSYDQRPESQYGTSSASCMLQPGPGGPGQGGQGQGQGGGVKLGSGMFDQGGVNWSVGSHVSSGMGRPAGNTWNPYTAGGALPSGGPAGGAARQAGAGAGAAANWAGPQAR